MTARRRRLLLPKEHGAYAEVGFPLLTVLLLGVPDLSALLLSLAVLCVFLLHEPVLVLLGHRGTRIRREARDLAPRLASLFAAGGLGFGIAGMWLAPATARWGAVVPLMLGIALLPLMATRREKTLAGELLAAAALVAACVPVALAASLPLIPTVIVSIVWGVTFGLATLAVRSTVIGAKRDVRRLRIITLSLALGAILTAAWIAATSGPPAGRGALALAPGSIATIALVSLRVPPRYLRAMGWAIAASNVMTFIFLLVLL